LDEHFDARRMHAVQVVGPPGRLTAHPSAVLNAAVINTYSGEVTVERHAFFGDDVMLLTGRHDYFKRGAARQDSVPDSGGNIVICEGAWVASRAIILGPCVVGKHAVVAAGSVVTRDVCDETIVGGVPARPIGLAAQSAP
jgi:acetyltransferase-like isoleucine patch superfamily enzyme